MAGRKLKLKDGEVHRRMMLAIARRAQEEIRKMRPESRIATVTAIAPMDNAARVQYRNDANDFPVRMGSARPWFVGQNVRVGRNQRGQRWIEDVVGHSRLWIPGDIKMSGCSQAYYAANMSDWYLCNGGLFDPNVDANLFAAIGYSYGSDITTGFPLLPNFTNSFPRGNSSSTGGGSDTHSHSQPNHTHSFSDGGHTHGSGSLTAQIVVNSSAILYTNAATSFSAGTQKAVSGATSTGTTTSNSVNVAGTTGSTTASGTTGSAGNDATGSSSNVPAYTGVNFYIKR